MTTKNLTDKETIRIISAHIGALKIAIDRAFEKGITPDEFEKIITSSEGQVKFKELVNQGIKHLESK